MKKLLLALAVSCLILAQEKVDEATDARIRSEESEHSQIMHTLHMLTDRYGPRVTGTPNHEAAAKWAVARDDRVGLEERPPGTLGLRASGLAQRARFGLHRFAGEGESEVRSAGLDAVDQRDGHRLGCPDRAAAGTPGAGRTEPPTRRQPGRSEDAAGAAALRHGSAPPRKRCDQWIAANRDKVRGKMVLVGKQTVVPVDFDPPAKRRPDDQVKAQYDPNNPGGGRGGRGGGGGRGRGTPGSDPPDRRRRWANRWTTCCSMAARWCASTTPRAAKASSWRKQHRAYDAAKTVPTVIVRNDDYGRIERLLADGEDVKLEFNIVNHVYPGGQDQLQRGGRDSRRRQGR